MPRDGRKKFSLRQHRMAMHVKSSIKAKGEDLEIAERVGWAMAQKDKSKGLRSLKRKK